MSSTVQSKADLKVWLERVKSAHSRNEVFAILDEFRKEEWKDDERAQMAHLYIRMLEVLGEDADYAQQSATASGTASSSDKKAPGDESEAEDATTGAAPKPDDGPVWYEKM